MSNTIKHEIPFKKKTNFKTKQNTKTHDLHTDDMQNNDMLNRLSVASALHDDTKREEVRFGMHPNEKQTIVSFGQGRVLRSAWQKEPLAYQEFSLPLIVCMPSIIHPGRWHGHPEPAAIFFFFFFKHEGSEDCFSQGTTGLCQLSCLSDMTCLSHPPRLTPPPPPPLPLLLR